MSIDANKNPLNVDFFTLKEDSRPADEKQFLQGLTLLADQVQVVLSQPHDIERAFQSIEKVELCQLNTNDPNYAIYQRFQDVFKKWVKVKLGDHFRHIPRELLVGECGDKFKGQFTCRMKEERDETVKLLLPDGLLPQEISPSLCEAFLIYLQTGEISDQALEEDVLTLLSLADQHRVVGLITKCLAIVEANLELDNLKIVLDFIENRHLPRLKMACLDFMHDHLDKIPLKLKSKYQEELSLLAVMIKYGMEQRISPTGNVEVQINSISDKIADILVKLDKLYPIQSLILAYKHQASQFSFLKRISPTLKGLLELIVTDASIQENALAELKNFFPKLNAFGNDAPFLKSFDEVNAYLRNFRKPGVDDHDLEKLCLRSLNLVNIPHLTEKQFEEFSLYFQEIYHLFIHSDKIREVAAPNAKRIHCKNCKSLAILKAPQAKEINCSVCKSLTVIKAHHAEKIDCHCCTNLITLETIQAIEIECFNCTNLTTLDAPQAKEINCTSCTSLSTLKAHLAIILFCINCTNLTTIEAPQAKEIFCRNCINLTTLRVPLAETIKCYNCPNLKILKVPQAKMINCSVCRSLEKIKVDQALEIDCSWCTSLTTLKANQANKIDCSNCSCLTTFVAPQAIVINCSGCKSFTTINAPQAKTINCAGCTSLTTIQAPQATRINCPHCTSLESIEALQAEKINCRECSNLTAVNAPKAKRIDK